MVRYFHLANKIQIVLNGENKIRRQIMLFDVKIIHFCEEKYCLQASRGKKYTCMNIKFPAVEGKNWKSRFFWG